MAKKQEVTKAPTGLAITRSGNNFTLTWKIGDKDYKDGQYFSYLINDTGNDKWSAADSIGKTATSKSIKINKDDYFPNTKSNGSFKPYLYDVRMRVKGNRATYTQKKKKHNPACSEWSTKQYDINVPRKPSLSVALSDSLSNVCVFSWSTEFNDTESHIYTDVQWQTVLVKNSNETDGSKISWKNATEGNSTAASNSRTITEDTAILYKNGDSYTRWFRVRSRGPRGASDWVYKNHVYALSNQAEISGVSSKIVGGGIQCRVTWTAAANHKNPNDQTVVQYAIAVPEANTKCPANASWNDVNISKDTAGSDAAVFTVDSSQLELDNCLFVRVNTKHDTYTTYGKAVCVRAGKLQTPSDLSVSSDDSTFRATITVTNNSTVPDSVLVVQYVPASGKVINSAVIPHGSNSVTVQCPDWSEESAKAFKVYAMVGSWSVSSTLPDISSVSIDGDPVMVSATLKAGGTVPAAPQNVSVQKTPIEGTVQVFWDWAWNEANGAEISWSDHPDAWESTDEPETYQISNLRASHWNISGLEIGKLWYVRVRLFMQASEEDINYGPYSSIEQGRIDLSSMPNKPVLVLSKSVIAGDADVTASWVYTSTDRTPQSYAEVALVEMHDVEVQTAAQADVVLRDALNNTDIYIKHVRSYDTILGHTDTAQHVTLNAVSAGFLVGNEYNLACRVRSVSGQISEWSDVVSLIVADPLVCTITQTSLTSVTEQRTVIDPDTGQEETFNVTNYTLTDLPLTVTITGAGVGGITSVAIERLQAFHLNRPDERETDGYKGETVAVKTQIGQSQMDFDVADLIGSFDDGAYYKMVATIQDDLGQTAQAELEFVVHWAHQAVIPSAKITVDEESLIVKIKPTAPASAISGDVCDIYRLSADRPELIVQGAQFGETYVDPYPALGEMGGHRIVFRTKNGDYTTANGNMAWFDTPELEVNSLDNEEGLNIIDFEGRQIRFYYDTDYSSTWAKDFQETQYLGGSVQGDWNAAVSRTGTLSTKAITVLDQEMLKDVRRLAVYTGLCHVRTADGSSYVADVQVSEDRVHDEQEMVANYSLSIIRVDSQEFEGMTLAQYEAEQGGN